MQEVRRILLQVNERVKTILMLACGVLALDIKYILKVNGWHEMIDLKCLSAELHNTPEQIAPALAKKISSWKNYYKRIFVAYGDRGSKGEIDLCRKLKIVYPMLAPV